MRVILLVLLLTCLSACGQKRTVTIYKTKIVHEAQQACTFEVDPEGITINCNEESVFIPTYEPVVDSFEIIDVCPEIDATFKEIIIKVNDELLVFFKNGNNEFLTTLVDGNYITTDERGCQFSIENGEIIIEEE